jgi:hypothetical protein
MTPPPATLPPMEKIELIQLSLRAFGFGLPGIVPFFGTPFAIVALRNNWRIKRRGGALWNPAQRYLFWGSVCARIGMTLTIIFTLLIALAKLLALLTFFE